MHCEKCGCAIPDTPVPPVSAAAVPQAQEIPFWQYLLHEVLSRIPFLGLIASLITAAKAPKGSALHHYALVKIIWAAILAIALPFLLILSVSIPY
ncbi:MAG: hypothetical protein IJN00_07295 [Clostridia bacterium]|nr:hypothetical protein [Clostridia bacterium]